MTGIPPRKIDPAYTSKTDALSSGHEAVIGTLGAAADLALPLAGPLVQALIRKCVQAPLEARREAWFNAIGEGLRDLQDRLEGFDPDRLAENEEFVSTVAETTRIAMATHRTEKLEALRNVVLNAAAGLTVDDISHGTFLSLIERFSTLHLRLAQVLNDPLSAPEIQAIGGAETTMPVAEALVRAFREKADRAAIGVALADLQSANLVRDMNTAAITPDPLTSRCLSPLGGAFLRFISSPIR